MLRNNYKKIKGNPCLNEIVYSVLRSASRDELLKLKGRFLKAAKSEKMAKLFAATASTDDKKTLLAEFGVRFFTILVNDETVTVTDLKEILDKFEENQKGSALENLADHEIYVESDKTYIHLLGLMANTSNHPSYKLSLEFNRAGYHSRKWSASTKNKHDENVSDTMKEADYVSKLMLSSCLIAERSPILFDITEPQLKILIYLYTKRHTHLTKEQVYEKFIGNYTIQMVATSLTKLKDRYFVDKHLTADPHQFTITSRGIGIINRYFTTVFNQI